MKEFYITDDGIRLHAKLDMPEGADRCPLVIVFHGITGHMEETHITAVQETALSAGYATLRVELYGHGGSDGEFKNHTLYKWISNAFAVVDYARALPFVTKLILMGHSQGGLLTILVAGMRPECFEAIIPLSPAVVLTEGARKGDFLGIPFDADKIPEELYWPDKDLTLSGDYFRTMQTLHPEDEIRRYHGPVLIIHGDADELVPFHDSEVVAGLYEHCSLIPIPGDTHCYDCHLDQVCAAEKEFLEKIRMV